MRWPFASLKRPENAPMEMLGSSGRFTVIEAGMKEPNVLVEHLILFASPMPHSP